MAVDGSRFRRSLRLLRASHGAHGSVPTPECGSPRRRAAARAGYPQVSVFAPPRGRSRWVTPARLGDDSEPESALNSGIIPLVWVCDEQRAVLESYVRLYIREVIPAAGLIRNLPGLARFVPIAALWHGQVVNKFSIVRDCGVVRTTVQGFLDTGGLLTGQCSVVSASRLPVACAQFRGLCAYTLAHKMDICA